MPKMVSSIVNSKEGKNQLPPLLSHHQMYARAQAKTSISSRCNLLKAAMKQIADCQLGCVRFYNLVASKRLEFANTTSEISSSSRSLFQKLKTKETNQMCRTPNPTDSAGSDLPRRNIPSQNLTIHTIILLTPFYRPSLTKAWCRMPY